MIRSLAAAMIVFGFTATLLALPSEVADARSHRGYAGKHTKHWSRHSSRNRSAAKANRRSAAVQAVPTITLGVPLAPPPPKRPLKLMTRAEILASDPARLERLGRRLIVGFESFDEVRTLVEKRAIAGIFVTDHNVRGRKATDVAKDIQSLQDIRKVQGLPRLFVAADQEGGYVSRLSPPLKKQPTLGMLVAKLQTDAEREKAVRDYAETQAHELDRLGITMNFGPVVDLRLGSPSRNDGETRLYWRAIDSDPYLVAKVAGWYCDTLTKFNIICTLKHFPGLGRVARDTHLVTGEISATETQLELSDWVPFRRLMGQPGVATMIGHVRINAVDPTTPASFSDKVINTVIRARSVGDVLLVTDDFSMGGVTHSQDGLGGAAIKAFNAGIDLVLLSYTSQDYDTLMSSLIEADINGEINQARQIESRERMAKYAFIDDTASAASPPLPAQHAPRSSN